ncbi:MAG: membrane-bound lytic murein transglycosylase MltF [Desulfobacteraceae bacterium]|nr:MAG: membrane-bound lytic murein transglycosylase MltF [Desulfobacteraceae bacterium]
MKLFFKTYGLLCGLVFICLVLVSWAVLIHYQKTGKFPPTYEQIISSGRLKLITHYAPSTYYTYQGQPTGFEYDLAKEFANYLDVDLEIITPGWNNMIPYLEKGKGDFLAASMTITRERLDHVVFSIPYMDIQQHLIHHRLVFGAKNIEDLSGKTIHVRRGTSYHYRLKQLKENGINLNYILHDNVSTEDMIKMVAQRDIKFTIADNNIATQNRRYYPDILIGIPVQKKEFLAWAVNPKNQKLQKEINAFFLWGIQNGIIELIQDKYYGNKENFDYFELKKFHERIVTRLPKYKDLIIKESETYGFDWRLVAAVVYQESHFNPRARSFTNVRGLMQVTRKTAEEMGIDNRLKPEQSIKAGIKYLNKMYLKFKDIDNPYQRMLFALASYNVGYGHVKDARQIAVEKGLNPDKWQVLKQMLPLLARSKYYKKTKYGYARGWEPVDYVRRILTYYDILKKKL